MDGGLTDNISTEVGNTRVGQQGSTEYSEGRLEMVLQMVFHVENEVPRVI